MLRNLLLLTLLVTGAALGAQHTWTGANGTSWTDAGNWNPASVPGTANNVVIPDTTNSPVISASTDVGSLTIEANATLTMSGSPILSVYGDWINNGTFVADSSIVNMRGDSDTVIGGSATTEFRYLYIEKTARSIEVVQQAAVLINGTGASATINSFDIRQGTYRNGGQGLAVMNGRTGGTTPANGELHISGGTVSLNAVHQFSQLKQFTITGGDVTISGQHSIVNSGHRFDMTGGTLHYTSTANNAVRCLSNNGMANGWHVSGGTVNLHGGLEIGTVNNTYQLTGTAVLRMVGTTSTSSNFHSTTSSGVQNVFLSNVVVDKGSGATATFTATGTGTLNSDLVMGNLTVESGSVAVLGGTSFGMGFGWNITNIDNSGTFGATSAITRLTGDLNGTSGSSASFSGVTELLGGTSKNLGGNVSFGAVSCTIPGYTLTFTAGNTLTLTGQMTLEGVPGLELRLRSSSPGTAWNLDNTAASAGVTGTFLDVQDSNASVNVTVASSVNSGNNTNWTFSGTASSHIWTGAVSTAWDNAGNWNPATVPTATDLVVIPDTSALSNEPTLAAASAARTVSIESGGVLNGGTGILTLQAHFINNGTFNAASSVVQLDGASASVIGGNNPTTMHRLIINKDARTTQVLQLTDLALTGTGTATTTMPLDIRRGSFFNNGNDLNAAFGRVSGTTPALGELHISGGDVVLGGVYQWSALKTFTISDGDVTIMTSHPVVNSGHLFQMTGGTLTYSSTTGTSTSAANVYVDGTASYIVTGGTVAYHGTVQVGGGTSTLQFAGTSQAIFAGTVSHTLNVRSGTGTVINVSFTDLSIEKMNGASLTITKTNVSDVPSSLNLGDVYVAPGAELVLNEIFEAGFGFNIDSIEVGGDLTLNANLVFIPGDIEVTSTGAIDAATNNTVSLVGAGPSSIIGDAAFNILECTVPARRVNFGAGDTVTINGSLSFIGTSGNEIELRSTNSGTQWNLQVNGSVTAQFCDIQDSNASSTVFAIPGGIDSGNNNNWSFTGGVSVTASTGSTQSAWANETGGGDGVVSGSFTIFNNETSTITLAEIVLEAVGTGNHDTAYSEVAIYIDNGTAGTQGVYDAADTLYGTALTAFNASGTATFTQNLDIAANETVLFFFVVKFDGATLASPGETYQAFVESIDIGGTIMTSGVPSATMPGFVMLQPVVNVTFPVTNNRPVADTYTGPGADGFIFERIRMVNNSPLDLPINNINLGGFTTGSAADRQVFTSVELFRDTNGSGSWERAHDDAMGNAATSFTADVIFNPTGAAAILGANETLDLFVVVKLNGIAVNNGIQYGIFFRPASSIGGANLTGSINSGSYRMTIQNASLYTTAEVGTPQNVIATSTSQTAAGTFVIENTSAATSVTLNGITIQSSGTGNDAQAYSEVAIYRDDNNNGVFDAGDVLFGTASTAFPSNNGSIAFNQAGGLAIAGGAAQRFFVVVRMNGATPAAAGDTFNYRVSAISSTVANDGGGLPSTIMQGIEIVSTALTVSATAGTVELEWADETGPGGNGLQVGTFEISNSATGTADLESITITASGTGDSAAAFSEVAVYQGTGASFDFNNDTEIELFNSGFSGTGTLTFNVPAAIQQFAASESRTFFVVVKLNNTAVPGETFLFTVTDIEVGAGAGKGGVPSTTMQGIEINAPQFDITDTSPATPGVGIPNNNDFVIQEIEIDYPAGPNNTLTELTFTGLATGGGNLQNDIVRADLWRDDNADGLFDPADDELVSSLTTGFDTNGQLIFTLTGAESQFSAGDTRLYFVTVRFDANAANGALYQTQLVDADGASTGTDINGLPAPAGGPAPGLEFFANNLDITLNGPGTPVTVNSNSQGPGNIGHVIWDGSFETINAAWTITEMTFEGTGTADHETAYIELALYEDTNASGTFDAGDQLAVAAVSVSFDSNGEYVAVLTDDDFPATSTRRFFLVGKLAGTATSGQTLNARLTGVTATPPVGGQTMGDIDVDSTALIIDVATLTMTAGPGAPSAAMLKAGTNQSRIHAHFRLTAANQDAIVTGISFNTGGSGNWVDYLDVATGVEIFSQAPSAAFDDTAATLVFSGPGAVPLAVTFTTALAIDNATAIDLWVRLNIVDTAALGEPLPRTMTMNVNSTASITETTGMTVVLGTPAPQAATLSIVDFFVTTFTPERDHPSGGEPIVITGSGFMTPFSVTIGGVQVAGTPSINAAGTEVTGLIVPPGSGTNLEIVVTSGSLAPQTLSQTFRYSTAAGGGSGGGGGGGCSQSGGSGLWWLALLAAPALLLRRRKQAKARI